VHYYSFNIADYRKDAGWLTVAESGIYRWLIDQYFLNESPIADDLRLLMRQMHLTSDQKELLTGVLEHFFILDGDQWHHSRIDAEIDEYQAKIEQARQAGIASGKARERKRTTVKRPLQSGSTESQPTKNHKPLTKNHKKTATFVAPSITEIQDYQKEKDLNLNPCQFHDFYESKGWLVGKSKMRDWKAAARGWSQRETKNETDKGTSTESHHATVVKMLRRRITAGDSDT
jgi:uncharacterized protein YdaU (DUF1376 family)